jgi:hypothetical protein
VTALRTSDVMLKKLVTVAVCRGFCSLCTCSFPHTHTSWIVFLCNEIALQMLDVHMRSEKNERLAEETGYVVMFDTANVRWLRFALSATAVFVVVHCSYVM